MVNTHEIQLGPIEFESLRDSDYIILKADNLEINDFILFKQVERTGQTSTETGLFIMTQVRKIIDGEGLKPGYHLLMVSKISY